MAETPTLEDYLAQEQLAKAGSVMARPQQPAWRKALSPAAGTPLDLLDAILSLANPVENISGPAQAMLGPIGRVTPEIAGKGAKAINQAQKKIVKALFRGDPETLKDVVKSPQMLHVGVPGAGGGVSKQQSQNLIEQVMKDAFAVFSPAGTGGTLRVHPMVMKGLDPKAGRRRIEPFITPEGRPSSRFVKVPPVLKQQNVEGLPDMAVHEATHFLNEPAFKGLFNVPGIDLKRLGNALTDFIGHTAYGPAVVQNKMATGKSPLAVNEALSYLSQPGGRTPAASWLQQALTSKPRAGGIGQFDPQTQGLLQEALDAAMRVPGAIR